MCLKGNIKKIIKKFTNLLSFAPVVRFAIFSFSFSLFQNQSTIIKLKTNIYYKLLVPVNHIPSYELLVPGLDQKTQKCFIEDPFQFLVYMEIKNLFKFE